MLREEIDKMKALAEENKMPINVISFIIDLKSINKLAKLAMEAGKIEYNPF